MTLDSFRVIKPLVRQDYNKGQMFVGVSNLMYSHLSFICKTIKWYIILLFHIITQKIMVKFLVLYQNIFDDTKLDIFKGQLSVNLSSR